MFDRHTYITESGGPQSITVRECRAPTDESVRLLKDMEAAARGKIVQSIRLENSPIDCVIHTEEDYVNQGLLFAVFIRINGKQIEIRKDFDAHGASLESIANGLLDAVSKRIAAEILAPAFTKVARNFRPTA